MILVPVPPHPTTITLTSRFNNSSCSLWVSMLYVQSGPPLSRPVFDRDKLRIGGSDFDPGRPKPPPPFRRLSRRSGRIPAEPYPPLKCLYCSRTKITILAQ